MEITSKFKCFLSIVIYVCLYVILLRNGCVTNSVCFLLLLGVFLCQGGACVELSLEQDESLQV